MNDAAWAVLEAERANLQPTPPIGTVVQWYKGGDKREVRAAQVTAIEGPGRVVVVINEPSAFPKTLKGVFHESHRIHERNNNQTTVRCGSWGYIPGTKPEDSHYNVHREELEKRLNNLRKADEEAAKIAKARETQVPLAPPLPDEPKTAVKKKKEQEAASTF